MDGRLLPSGAEHHALVTTLFLPCTYTRVQARWRPLCSLNNESTPQEYLRGTTVDSDRNYNKWRE